MLDTATLLTLTPQKALVAAYNDQTGLNVPHGQAVFSAPEDLGNGLTRITLSIRPAMSSYEVLPYTGSDPFTYQRLNLADLASLIADGLTDYAPALPTTTGAVAADLQVLFGIVFDSSDIIDEVIQEGSTGFTLQAAPVSLRWYGELTLPWGQTQAV